MPIPGAFARAIGSVMERRDTDMTRRNMELARRDEFVLTKKWRDNQDRQAEIRHTERMRLAEEQETRHLEDRTERRRELGIDLETGVYNPALDPSHLRERARMSLYGDQPTPEGMHRNLVTGQLVTKPRPREEPWTIEATTEGIVRINRDTGVAELIRGPDGKPVFPPVRGDDEILSKYLRLGGPDGPGTPPPGTPPPGDTEDDEDTSGEDFDVGALLGRMNQALRDNTITIDDHTRLKTRHQELYPWYWEDSNVPPPDEELETPPPSTWRDTIGANLRGGPSGVTRTIGRRQW